MNETAAATPPVPPSAPSLAARWWTRVARRLGEIAIVTIGILLAFALDAWWDNHTLAAQEQVHLRALASDLQRNVTALKTQIDLEERIIASSEKLLKLSQGSGNEGAPLAELVNQVFNSGRYEPVMGAYEALVNSGGLTMIRDEDLRAALAEFAARASGKYAESWSDQQYFSFAREYAGRISLLYLRDPSAQTHEREFKAMLAEPKFLENLALRYYSERDMSQKYLGLKQEAEALLVKLRAEIAE
jgi:hypothetical protein